MKKTFLTTRQLTATALGAALIAICSWISIPAAVPFTMQTFAVFLVSALLGLKCGTLSVLVYLLLGAVGLPVFAGGQSGIGYLFGLTGGYLTGFIFLALSVGTMKKLLGAKLPVLICGMLLGLAICYCFGSVWFMQVYARTKGAIAVLSVLQMCVLPYLIPDGVKLVLAVILFRVLDPHIPAGMRS